MVFFLSFKYKQVVVLPNLSTNKTWDFIPIFLLLSAIKKTVFKETSLPIVDQF
jgi:hypothetical protein